MVRVKHRYFLLEVIPNGFPDTQACSGPIPGVRQSCIHKSIIHAVETLHGDFGVAAVSKGIRTKYLNPNTRIVILRCGRGPHKFIATALPLVTKIENIHASLRLLHLSGTIRSCNKFLINYHQKELFKKYASCTPVEKAEFKKTVETFQFKTDWKI